MTLICNKCGQEKHITLFHKVATLSSTNFSFKGITKNLYEGVYYGNTCKECKAKLAKDYRDARPGLWKKYRNGTTMQSFKNLSAKDKLLHSAIRRRILDCKQNNKRHKERPFDLDFEYMLNLWKKQKGNCYLTGVPLEIDKQNPRALSIDKIIPEKGYVKGNVLWCAWAANRAKGDLQLKALFGLSKRILDRATTIEKIVEETQQELSRVDSSESKSTAPNKCCD